ncbi:MAG TPA: hypothetical protein VH502_13960 [Actinoplanes sp.]
MWRKTRTEVAGAWRSVRYDMGRRPAEPSAEPDVTSTGMSTFGGAVGEATGSPRRLVTVSAFGVLVMAGAAGTYFAVAGGLGALLTEQPAAAQPNPLAAAPPAGDPSAAGIGHGPAAADHPDAPAGTVPAATPVATAATPAAVPSRVLPRATRVAPERANPPAPRPCACPAPPVPTPTDPVSPSAAPSPSPSPSESASPSPSPSPSASSASESAEAMMRRSHRHRY